MPFHHSDSVHTFSPINATIRYAGVPILMGLVINFPQDFLARELAALMVNISYNPRNCEQMIQNKGEYVL